MIRGEIVIIIIVIPWLTRFLLFQQGRLIAKFPQNREIF